jgi:hypothetical protein
MKRAISGVVLGLGVFLLVVAALVRFYAVPNLVKIPLDQNVSSVSEATGATYLDLSTLSIKTDQNLRATREIRGDVKASSKDTVVFDAFVRVENIADGSLVSGTTDRVALDRRKAQAVRCCNEAVDSKPTVHTGLSYTFPMGTEQKTYQFFDTTVSKPFPISYRGTEQVKGLKTYRFEQEISEQPIGTQEVPGALVGQPNELSVQVDQLYSNVRTVWVEPSTGAIVKGQEDQLRVLRGTSGSDTTVLAAKIAFTDKTVGDSVKRAKDGMAQAAAVSVIAPLVALILGLILLVIGLVLFVRNRAAAGAPVGRHDEEQESVHV